MPFISPDELALMIPIIAVSIPIVAIWTKHQQRMAEIKFQQGTALAPDVRAELDRLRDEVTALRETTTRFDMSFDAALTRLEDRMENSESVVAPSDLRRTPVAVGQDSTSETLFVGRGR